MWTPSQKGNTHARPTSFPGVVESVSVVLESKTLTLNRLYSPEPPDVEDHLRSKEATLDSSFLRDGRTGVDGPHLEGSSPPSSDTEVTMSIRDENDSQSKRTSYKEVNSIRESS